MIKPRISSSNYLRNLLKENQLENLIRYFDIELFQFRPITKSVFLDWDGKLRTTLPVETILYTVYADKNRLLFLQVPDGKGSVNEWKDILSDQQYDDHHG